MRIDAQHGIMLDMPRKGKDHDFATIARRVVETAIGEHLDGSPLENPDAGKDPKAIQRGRTGGKSGGVARAKALTPERKRAIAKAAASARWGKD